MAETLINSGKRIRKDILFMRSDKKSNSVSALSDGQSSAEGIISPNPGKKGPSRRKHRLNKKRFILFILGIILACIIGVGIYVGVIISQAPSINTDDIYTLLTESTVIYDSNGDEIDTVYTEADRDNVTIDQIPEDLQDAFIALEDKTFRKHHGFNFIRMLGAIKDAVFSDNSISGTSTISQQLARNLYLPEEKSERTIKRKIVEAYYTVILEKNLSKDQILEAYINTVPFGYNTEGAQAAAQAYFSKDVGELTLAQCAALAALPQQPTTYALVQFVDSSTVDKDDPNVLKVTSEGTYVANDTSKSRRETCLSLMLEQGYITQEEYDEAVNTSLVDMLDPSYTAATGQVDYFADYVIKEVIADLQEEAGYSYEDAWNAVYNEGLKIYSTLDPVAQEVVETEFANSSNFPGVTYNTDGAGNIINRNGAVSLYNYNNYFDSERNFTMTSDEAVVNEDGSVTIKAGKRLNIYDTEVNGAVDYSVEFKALYTRGDDGRLYTMSGGYINIPQGFKSKDSDGNLVISADLFKTEGYENFFVFNDDGTVTVPFGSYTLQARAVQPQAAMTIVENSTGHIKAMVGGRETSGRMVFNRASDSLRQPGSSIKPLTVYSPALQQSADEAAAGTKHQFKDLGIDEQGAKYYGSYMTASSVIIDEPTTIEGRVWPKNYGGGYSGPTTFRRALYNSLNTCAAKIILQTGVDYAATYLDKFGITTAVTEGNVNDINVAALALGGMTHGVTTLEMAGAYTTFPNNGTRVDTSSYTKVEDRSGNVILENNPETHEVLNAGVAWIMTDIMKGNVRAGTAVNAAISGVAAGGKTGTTDDEYDIWFNGFTPTYSAALWIGNDQNFAVAAGSSTAAALWGKIMNQIPNAKSGSYSSAPSNVVTVNGEYYISGTQVGLTSVSDVKMQEVKICSDTGYLATPDCPHVKTEEMIGLDVPKYYCYMHNADPDKYPVSPDETLVPFEPAKPEEPEEDEKPDKEEPPDEGEDTGSGGENTGGDNQGGETGGGDDQGGGNTGGGAQEDSDNEAA